MSGWFRRNRLALAALPVAVVLAAAGNSSRLQDYWYDLGMRDAQVAGPDGVARFAGEYNDGHLQYDITANISLTSIESVTTVTDADGTEVEARIPEGAALWRISLHWDVAPEVVMSGCRIGIAGVDGRFWAPGFTPQYESTVLPSVFPCVPGETPGPEVPIGQTQVVQPPPEAQRPPVYDTVTYVVTAADATPEQVRVWWVLPDYAALPVPG